MHVVALIEISVNICYCAENRFIQVLNSAYSN